MLVLKERISVGFGAPELPHILDLAMLALVLDQGPLGLKRLAAVHLVTCISTKT